MEERHHGNDNSVEQDAAKFDMGLTGECQPIRLENLYHVTQTNQSERDILTT